MAVDDEHRQGPTTTNAGTRDVAELSAALAPLEEQNPEAAGLDPRRAEEAAKIDEAIVVDASSLKLPKGILTDEPYNVWRPPPIVVAIVVIFLIFIAFIAWQISKMPPQ